MPRNVIQVSEIEVSNKLRKKSFIAPNVWHLNRHNSLGVCRGASRSDGLHEALVNDDLHEQSRHVFAGLILIQE